METPEFHDFFSKSSRWIERALDDPYDLLIDYGDEHATKKCVLCMFELYRFNSLFYRSVDAGQGLSLDTCYEAEEYTRSRFVADIDFSPKVFSFWSVIFYTIDLNGRIVFGTCARNISTSSWNGGRRRWLSTRLEPTLTIAPRIRLYCSGDTISVTI